MKLNLNFLVKFTVVLVAFAILNSACSLNDFFAAQCARGTFVVTKVVDTAAEPCSASNCSLREAVILSNSCQGTQTIQIPAGTYVLTHSGANETAALTGDLNLTDNVIIQGMGNPIIDGNATDRIFKIIAGKTVTMSNLVLQNGRTPTEGSAIYNEGVLTLDHVVVQNNHQTDLGGVGGAIFNSGSGSSVTLTSSAVVNNWSAEEAGGLFNGNSTMTLDNVTVSGNHGYGIENRDGQMNINFSTIANSLATGSDGLGAYEIFDHGGSIHISNSIIAGHTTDGNCYQPLVSGGYNIDSSVGGTDNTCGLNGPYDQVGHNPLLRPLADNGGSTLTMALDASLSPAINAADSAHCDAADQRGIPRPQGHNCDIGAFEAEVQIAPGRTVQQLPTETSAPAPSATPAAPTDTPTAEVTLTPTTALATQLILNKNANCRKGPGLGYDVVTAYEKGKSLALQGQNELKTWVQVQIPQSNASCWVVLSTGDANGSLSALPVFPTQPLTDAPASLSDSSKCDPKMKSFEVTLTWPGVANAAGYRIYRNGEQVGSSKSNTYVDHPPLGTAYMYELAANNAFGESVHVSTQVGACH